MSTGVPGYPEVDESGCVLILSEEEVRSCLPMKDAITAVRQAYIAFAEGRVTIPPVVHLSVEKYNGEVDIKSGYVEDFGLIGTKIASGFYDNPKIGLRSSVAIVILMDLKTSLLDPKIMKRAKIVLDSLKQCRVIGETQHALSQGLIRETDIHAEIGEILNGRKKGRESNDEITVFDSTGIAAQDIAAANIAYHLAQERKIGKSVKLLEPHYK